MNKITKTEKYKYPERIKLENRKWPEKIIKKTPVWTSVDLRDGNQALPVPMTPEMKLEYFHALVKTGFKEIEIGFPSASKADYDFVRQLIEENHIPENVKISVLTQARKHLIEKTVESLKGAESCIIHCYVASSDLHGKLVFGKERKQVLEMAENGTRMVKDAVESAGMSRQTAYEFSPEEFTDSDLDFVLEICHKVKEIWGESRKENFILNLPATVERRPPNQYADMIEYFNDNYKYSDETTVSVHAHNDQGCAVAAGELALLAGAERVEGTLFGHGERTGNLDLVTLALNLKGRGIDIGLDFSDLPSLVKLVEKCSNIPVHQRHPYAGELVFTAFSGSHQDAIRKGIAEKNNAGKNFGVGWKVPYLHIDPADIGRKYEKLIRINSQSGKGGAAYVLEKEYGIRTPKAMHPQIGEAVQISADVQGAEINAENLLKIFEENFMKSKGAYKFKDLNRINDSNADHEHIKVELILEINGDETVLTGEGNGPISAVVHALKTSDKVIDFVLEDFSEQTMGKDADAKAMAFIGIRFDQGNKLIYGAGKHSNIDMAAITAVFSALNKACEKSSAKC